MKPCRLQSLTRSVHLQLSPSPRPLLPAPPRSGPFQHRNLSGASSVLQSQSAGHERVPFRLSLHRFTPRASAATSQSRSLHRNRVHPLTHAEALASSAPFIASTPRSAARLESNSTTSTGALLALLALGAFAAWTFTGTHLEVDSGFLQEEEPLQTLIMAVEIPPGRPGNLTPEQEEKLRKLWQAVFNLCGVGEDAGSAATPAAASETPDKASATDDKKKRFNVFRKKTDGKSADVPSKDAPEDDKYGQTKQFYDTLATQTPESLHETIWTMVKHDHPDALLLRFLRARKWDVEKALVMFVSTINWRHTEMHLDDEIMRRGEAGFLADEQSGQGAAKALGHDFLKQLRMGKTFLHGKDKQGRPICFVRVKLHKAADQSEESLEKSTVYIIETTRMLIEPPVDTATIVFDMTGFSLANMDYAPVKFMIRCFEANYPECLGAVLVHNAPWVFQGIWKIIRGWLDPVVAAKVHFTNNKTELEQFIEPSQILKDLGGPSTWEYKYTEPVPGENDKMKDTETRDRLLKGREELVNKFEAATLQWIEQADGDKGKEIREKRHQLAAELREDYWRLDPYIRARSVYDREGILQAGGRVDWSGQKAESKAVAAQTSADDVD